MSHAYKAGRAGMMALALAAAVACGRGTERDDDSLVTGMPGTGGDSAAAATATPNAEFAQMSDANIASTIGVINSGEIQAAELAVKSASSAEVKNFARDMITEHRAMQQAVDSLAAAKNITPQTIGFADNLQSDAQSTKSRLEGMKGAAFDSAYMNAQVMDHQKALDALNGMAASADDADVRALIQGALPKVQAHLDRARQLAAAPASATTGDTTHR